MCPLITSILVISSLSTPKTSLTPICQCGKALAFYGLFSSWASKKFMSGCVILLPIAVTFYITWWFIKFFDGFFSPIYDLGIHFFGLRFVTPFLFIFLVGVFVSLWIGVSMLLIGEWFIKRMPLVKHVYSASKQISDAISPGVAFACPGIVLGGVAVSNFYMQACVSQELYCKVVSNTLKLPPLLNFIAELTQTINDTSYYSCTKVSFYFHNVDIKLMCFNVSP